MESWYALGNNKKDIAGREIGKFNFVGVANGNTEPHHSEAEILRDKRAWIAINDADDRAHKFWHENCNPSYYIAGNWGEARFGKKLKVFESGEWSHSSNDVVKVIGYVWADMKGHYHFHKYARPKRMPIGHF